MCVEKTAYVIKIKFTIIFFIGSKLSYAAAGGHGGWRMETLKLRVVKVSAEAEPSIFHIYVMYK